jgi:Cu(I)/Ag(I) efflux system membrane fusion protein
VQLPDREQPTFEGREILLGERAGDFFVVRHGLKKGERVVTNGNFKLDSALQIKARPSMMSPESVTEIKKLDLNVPTAFRQKLTPLYEAYLAAAESLAANKMNEAELALAKIPTTLTGLETSSLNEATKKYWKQIVDQIVFAAYETEDAKRRELLSRHFAELSNTMIELTINFGHAMPGPLYRLHCPMATGAKGADWLQTTKQVHNPYYGLAMHDCGDLVTTYESQAPLDVPEQFRQQLAGLYDSYFQVQTMLADDKLNETKLALTQFQTAIAKPQANLLKGRTLAAWTASHAALSEAMQGDWPSEEVKKIRKRFEAISNTMLKVDDLFGHVGTKKHYKAFCPMAFENQGAAWLQADKEIANPYFGHQMLRCGEIQRDFPPVNGSQEEEDRGREHRHEP